MSKQLEPRIERLEQANAGNDMLVRDLIEGAARCAEIIRCRNFSRERDDAPLEVQLERVMTEPVDSAPWCADFDRKVRAYQIRQLEIAIMERDGMSAEEVETLRSRNLHVLRGGRDSEHSIAVTQEKHVVASTPHGVEHRGLSDRGNEPKAPRQPDVDKLADYRSRETEQNVVDQINMEVEYGLVRGHG